MDGNLQCHLQSDSQGAIIFETIPVILQNIAASKGGGNEGERWDSMLTLDLCTAI